MEPVTLPMDIGIILEFAQLVMQYVRPVPEVVLLIVLPVKELFHLQQLAHVQPMNIKMEVVLVQHVIPDVKHVLDQE